MSTTTEYTGQPGPGQPDGGRGSYSPPPGYGYGMGGRPRMMSYPSETKPFFLTSEFILPFLAWIGLLVTTTTNGEVGARYFWMWTMLLLIGYMISRGLAKSGIRSRSMDPRDDPTLLQRGHQHSHH